MFDLRLNKEEKSFEKLVFGNQQIWKTDIPFNEFKEIILFQNKLDD